MRGGNGGWSASEVVRRRVRWGRGDGGTASLSPGGEEATTRVASLGSGEAESRDDGEHGRYATWWVTLMTLTSCVRACVMPDRRVRCTRRMYPPYTSGWVGGIGAGAATESKGISKESQRESPWIWPTLSATLDPLKSYMTYAADPPWRGLHSGADWEAGPSRADRESRISQTIALPNSNPNPNTSHNTQCTCLIMLPFLPYQCPCVIISQNLSRLFISWPG